jgi:hypothetical protein
VEQRERALGSSQQPHAPATRSTTAYALDRHHASTAPAGLAITPAAVRRPVPPFANLRRNVCPHFFITGSRGALPIQAPHLLKALIRQSSTVSRCQLRGGVHLAEDFVNDVCLAARFNQCVFYEDDLTSGT